MRIALHFEIRRPSLPLRDKCQGSGSLGMEENVEGKGFNTSHLLETYYQLLL